MRGPSAFTNSASTPWEKITGTVSGSGRGPAIGREDRSSRGALPSVGCRNSRSPPRCGMDETMSATQERFAALMRSRPVLLAPMEDVSDAVFRRICRRFGADACFTEFINVESLLGGCERAEKKIRLEADDVTTAIQIYGANPATLIEA